MDYLIFIWKQNDNEYQYKSDLKAIIHSQMDVPKHSAKPNYMRNIVWAYENVFWYFHGQNINELDSCWCMIENGPTGLDRHGLSLYQSIFCWWGMNGKVMILNSNVIVATTRYNMYAKGLHGWTSCYSSRRPEHMSANIATAIDMIQKMAQQQIVIWFYYLNTLQRPLMIQLFDWLAETKSWSGDGSIM